MRGDIEAEKMLAAYYLRDKLANIMGCPVEGRQFVALPQIGPVWHAAREMTKQRREWLPMDVDRHGTLDELLRDVVAMPSQLGLCERRVAESAALVFFRHDSEKLVSASRELSLAEVSSEARQIVGELESRGPVKAVTFAEAGKARITKFFAAHQDPEKGNRTIRMPTPLMQNALGGWRRGKVHLVGAITSGYKTTVSLKSCEVACRAGEHGLYWTAEDSNDDMAGRTLARNINDLTTGRIETLDTSDLAPEQWSKIVGAAEVVNEDWAGRMRLIDKPNPTLYEVIGTIRQQASKRLDFVVFDFLQRIRPDEKTHDMTAFWDRCTAELRALAQQLDIALVCPVQPTQEGTKRVEDGKPLRIGDLRGGSAIAQNAYGVLTLFRNQKGLLEIYVRKWKGADQHKFKCWVSGMSDDFGDLSNRS